METLSIRLEVLLSTANGMELAEKEQLTDQFTDYVYKYFTHQVQVRKVEVVSINGEPVS